MKNLKLNKINNFIHNFHKGNISVLTFNSEIDTKLLNFISYLVKDSAVIKESKSEIILDILGTYRNQNVFIYTPTNLWTYSSVKDKAEMLRDTMREIHKVSVSNNLSILVSAYIYSSIITSSNSVSTGVSYVSDYIVSYSQDIFKVMKSRSGDYDMIDIHDMSFLFREEKLKRILE